MHLAVFSSESVKSPVNLAVSLSRHEREKARREAPATRRSEAPAAGRADLAPPAKRGHVVPCLCAVAVSGASVGKRLVPRWACPALELIALGRARARYTSARPRGH
eukprot:759135-Prymnesium_polylepis.1